MADVLHFKTREEARQAILGMGCSREGAVIMAPKALFSVVRLEGVRSAVGNLIKQEMLACGGDAAVNDKCINCSAPTTDVILMGTLAQYSRFLSVIRSQYQFPEHLRLVEELESALKE